MTYHELMTGFGEKVDLPHFAPNEQGLCEIYSEQGTITFQHVPEEEMVLTTGVVCRLGAAPSARFYRTFLEANFMYQKTRGSTLSIDPETNAVMLTRYDRLCDLTLDRFVATVEAFATALVEWREWQYDADNAEVSAVVDTLVEGGLIA